MTDDDRDLRETFQAAREAERAQAPSFQGVLAGRSRRRRRVAPGLLAAAGALALVAVTVWRFRPEVPPSEVELARRIMAWRSPTGFLLPADAPGLLSFVPRIGEAPAGSPLQALDPGNVLGPPVLQRSPRS